MWQIIVPITILVVVGVPITILLIKMEKRRKDEYGDYTFKTKYGTRVWLTPTSKAAGLNKGSFEKWTESVSAFWEEKKGWSKDKSIKIIGELMVRLKDEYRFETPHYKDKKAGLAHIGGYLIEESCVEEDNSYSEKRTASLFRHETSHFILYRVGGVGNPMDGSMNNEHHQMFKDEGLGA